MEVFEHEHGRRLSAKLIGECPDQVVRLGLGGNRLRELATGLVGDVEQRSERSRREKRFAPAPEKPRAVALLLAEAPEEGRFAAPGLPGNKNNPPTGPARGGGEPVSKGREL